MIRRKFWDNSKNGPKTNSWLASRCMIAAVTSCTTADSPSQVTSSFLTMVLVLAKARSTIRWPPPKNRTQPIVVISTPGLKMSQPHLTTWTRRILSLPISTDYTTPLTMARDLRKTKPPTNGIHHSRRASQLPLTLMRRPVWPRAGESLFARMPPWFTRHCQPFPPLLLSMADVSL